MTVLPDSFERIKFFEKYIEDYISSLLRKNKQHVNVRFYNNDNCGGYYFKVLYFPTDTSCAGLPKVLPDSVLEKFRTRRDILNCHWYPVEEYDKLSGKNFKITYIHLEKTKMNKTMKSKLSEFVVMNNVKDFFNLGD